MLHTPFYNFLKKQNAHFTLFAGWEMPVYFSSIKDEHYSVRNNAGLFDISHMGKIKVTGKDAQKVISYLVTNDITTINSYNALYTLICNTKGYIVDDIIIYKNSSTDFFLIINASNIESVHNLLIEIAKEKSVNIENMTNTLAGLALQGPNSTEILKAMFGTSFQLDYFKFKKGNFNSNSILVARTGYTGEIGYELWMNNNITETVIDFLVNKLNITLCGLGARDVLRLEAGYLLYGNELSLKVNPVQAGLKWAVKLNKPDFMGKSALIEHSKTNKWRLIGLLVNSKIMLRKGTELYYNDKNIGFVTSGSFSFIKNQPIALGYINSEKVKENTKIIGIIRNKKIEAQVTKPRFYYNSNIKESIKKWS